MDIKKAKKILTEYINTDREMRRGQVESDYEKFCEEVCVAIETVMKSNEDKDRIIEQLIK